MAEIGVAVLGGGVALAVAGYSNGTGFVARHETSHAQQVAEMKRIIADFEEAFKRQEVSEEDWKQFLVIRTEARVTEAEYEESLEDYKDTPVYQFISKWKKLHHVRKKKRKMRKVNKEMRLHYYDSTSEASDTSSTTAESGSPPRNFGRTRRYSDEDDKRVLFWANAVASESEDDEAVVNEKLHGACAVHTIPEHDHMILEHDHSIETVSFSPDGRDILSGSTSCIHIWNLEARKTSDQHPLDIHSPPGIASDFQTMALSPDYKSVASCYFNGEIWHSDAHTGKLLSKLSRERSDSHEQPEVKSARLSQLVYTPDSKRIATGFVNGTIQIWDTDSGRSLFYPIDIKGNLGMSCFRLSSNGTRIALGTAGRQFNVLVSDVETGTTISGPLIGHEERTSSVVFSSDDSSLVSSSCDNTIRIWDSRTRKTGNAVRRLVGHTDRVKCIDLSPDERRVASGSSDNTVRIWDTRTGKALETLKGHHDDIKCVAFSPDGKSVVSGSDDRTVRIWDILVLE